MLHHRYFTTTAIATLTLTCTHLIASQMTGNIAYAADLTEEFDKKHKECLERIAEDSEAALEDAMIWRSEGGGRRAKHCEAMALFALGHESEAAHRLDKLAKASDGGSPEMRANFYAEAANFWLAEGNLEKAYLSASAGLDLKKDHLDLRIARARSYALNKRYDYAEIDLTSVLVFESDHVSALRYRADARLNQNKLDAALADIEKAMTLAPDNVETAVMRGRIKEAIRLKQSDKGEENTSPQEMDILPKTNTLSEQNLLDKTKKDASDTTETSLENKIENEL